MRDLVRRVARFLLADPVADVTGWNASTGKWVTFKRAKPKPPTGAPEPMVFNGYRISNEIPSQPPMNETCQKIFDVMADGVARPPSEISDIVGVTAATVRYHLARRDEFRMIGEFVKSGGGRPVEFWQMNLDEKRP